MGTVHKKQANREILSQVDISDECHYADKLINLITGYVYGGKKNPPTQITEALQKLSHVVELAIGRGRNEARHDLADKKEYYLGTWQEELLGPYESLEECQKDAKKYEKHEYAKVYVKLNAKDQRFRISEFNARLAMLGQVESEDASHEDI